METAIVITDTGTWVDIATAAAAPALVAVLHIMSGLLIFLIKVFRKFVTEIPRLCNLFAPRPLPSSPPQEAANYFVFLLG